MKQLLVLAAAVMFLMASCTKSDTSTLENTDIIRNGKWKMTAFTVNLTDPFAHKDTVMDLFKVIDSCRMDDYLQFNEQYKGVLNTNTRKCGSQSTELPFNWELRNDQTTLMLNDLKYLVGNMSELPNFPKGLDYVEATIKRMNKASFVITYSTTEVFIPLFVPVKYNFTQTFTKM